MYSGAHDKHPADRTGEGTLFDRKLTGKVAHGDEAGS